MKEKSPIGFLTELYNNAMTVVGSQETITSDLDELERQLLDTILLGTSKSSVDRHNNKHHLQSVAPRAGYKKPSGKYCWWLFRQNF
jgi:hypothetical protein